MADIKKVTKSLDSIYNRLGGWMTVSELDTITEAKELLKEQNAVIKELRASTDALAQKINYHSCNTCARDCDYKPNLGERVRSNCMFWIDKTNKNKCGTCKQFIGAGDWDMCCKKQKVRLCYKETDACEEWEGKVGEQE